MFGENEKFADELFYCGQIIEENNGKTYIFENGEKLHLDNEYKICSDLKDGKIKIEKNGLYGAVIFYNENMIKDLDVVDLFSKSSFDDKKIKEIKKNGYVIVEPNYENVSIGKDYMNTIRGNKCYIFDAYGDKKLEFEKANDFRVINESTIFNNGILYEGLFGRPARLYNSKDLEKIYITPFIENDETLSRATRNSFDDIIVYSKDGKLINKINSKSDMGFEFSLLDIAPTSDSDILLIESGWFLNVKTGKMSGKLYLKSDFKDGYSIIKTDSEIGIYDTNLDVKSQKYDFRIQEFEVNESNPFNYRFDYDYLPIYKYKRKVQRSFYVDDFNKKQYGYCDINLDIVIPCKYKSYEDAKKALEKYVEKKNKKEQKLLKKQGNKEVLSEQSDSKDIYSEIYELEDKIKGYLSKINVEELNIKLKLMQRDYKNAISKTVEEDKTTLKNNELILNLNDKKVKPQMSKLVYDNYKNELEGFINKLEDNIYIVNILERINNADNILYGKNINLKDGFIVYLKKLYDLYFTLNEEKRDKNISKFRNMLREEKQYFKDCLLKKEVQCKYTSENEWESEVIKKLKDLVKEFKSDYNYMNEQGEIERARIIEELKEKYKDEPVVRLYGKVVEEIRNLKTKTNDLDILTELDECEKIDFKHCKNSEELYNEIMKTKVKLELISDRINDRLEIEKFNSYDKNRDENKNTK